MNEWDVMKVEEETRKKVLYKSEKVKIPSFLVLIFFIWHIDEKFVTLLLPLSSYIYA